MACHAHAAATRSKARIASSRFHAGGHASRRAGLCTATALGTALLAVSVVTPADAQNRGDPESADTIQMAQSDQRQRFDIAAQPLPAALDRFEDRTGISLDYETSALAGSKTPGVSGEYTPKNALDRLLAGTGVSADFTGDDTVTLTQATAQNEGGAERLGEITVEATGESAYGPVDGYKAERSATATRTDTPVMDVPGSIQVVPRDVIDDQEARDLSEVVRNVSSVFVDNSFGGIGRDFNIRGFNQEFKLRNGFREENTAINRTQDLANVERVEVLKGPSSIISGRLSPGGVVNVVTKRPTDEPMYRFSLEGGTTIEGGHRTEPSIDFSGPLTDAGRVKYRLNASYLHEEPFRQPFDENVDRFFVAPVLSFDLGPDTELIVEGEYTNDERPFDRGIIHFNGTFSDRDRNLQSESVVSDKESAIASYTLDHRFTDNLRLKQRSQFIWLERFNLENVPFQAATSSNFSNVQRGDFARFIGANDAVERVFSTQTELHGTLDGPLAEHDILFAFDYARTWEDRQFKSSDSSFAFPTFMGVENKINIFNPVDNVPAPSRDDLTHVGQDRDDLTEEFGVVLQDQITISEQWEVLLGGRLTWTDQETVENVANMTDTAQNDAVFTPRAGLVYKPIETVSLYGSYSESFEPQNPSTVDRQGNILEPTEGQQFELGAKAEFFDRRLRTTLAGFHLTKTNIARSVPMRNFSVATGEERSRGIELDVTGQITEGWTVIGSYAFLDTEITEDNTNEGNELDGVPTHSASLWSNYELQSGTLEGLQLGAGAFYRGERQADTGNTFTLPSFTRVDARIGYQRNNWEANLSVKNLFDTNDNYEAIDFAPLVQPGIPLTAVASVSVNF